MPTLYKLWGIRVRPELLGEKLLYIAHPSHMERMTYMFPSGVHKWSHHQKRSYSLSWFCRVFLGCAQKVHIPFFRRAIKGKKAEALAF